MGEYKFDDAKFRELLEIVLVEFTEKELWRALRSAYSSDNPISFLLDVVTRKIEQIRKKQIRLCWDYLPAQMTPSLNRLYTLADWLCVELKNSESDKSSRQVSSS